MIARKKILFKENESFPYVFLFLSRRGEHVECSFNLSLITRREKIALPGSREFIDDKQIEK